MANRRWTADFERHKTCGCGKVMFDKKTAQTKMNWLLKRGNEKALRIYQCPQSDTWHLTKTRVW